MLVIVSFLRESLPENAFVVAGRIKSAIQESALPEDSWTVKTKKLSAIQNGKYDVFIYEAKCRYPAQGIGRRLLTTPKERATVEKEVREYVEDLRLKDVSVRLAEGGRKLILRKR